MGFNIYSKTGALAAVAYLKNYVIKIMVQNYKKKKEYSKNYIFNDFFVCDCKCIY